MEGRGGIRSGEGVVMTHGQVAWLHEGGKSWYPPGLACPTCPSNYITAERNPAEPLCGRLTLRISFGSSASWHFRLSCVSAASTVLVTSTDTANVLRPEPHVVAEDETPTPLNMAPMPRLHTAAKLVDTDIIAVGQAVRALRVLQVAWPGPWANRLVSECGAVLIEIAAAAAHRSTRANHIVSA